MLIERKITIENLLKKPNNGGIPANESKLKINDIKIKLLVFFFFNSFRFLILKLLKKKKNIKKNKNNNK